jgi:hypothetical protein
MSTRKPQDPDGVVGGEGNSGVDDRSLLVGPTEAEIAVTEREQRRRMGLEWVRAMNVAQGKPSAEDYDAADRLLDELGVKPTR